MMPVDTALMHTKSLFLSDFFLLTSDLDTVTHVILPLIQRRMAALYYVEPNNLFTNNKKNPLKYFFTQKLSKKSAYTTMMIDKRPPKWVDKSVKIRKKNYLTSSLDSFSMSSNANRPSTTWSTSTRMTCNKQFGNVLRP